MFEILDDTQLKIKFTVFEKDKPFKTYYQEIDFDI